MCKRRMFIILLFIAIGVFAVSRTVLLRQSVREEQGALHSIREDRGMKELRESCVRLLDRLLIAAVVCPFFITAFLLFLYTLSE